MAFESVMTGSKLNGLIVFFYLVVIATGSKELVIGAPLEAAHFLSVAL